MQKGNAFIIILLVRLCPIIPFALSGYEAGSLQEAIEWARKCPNPTGDESELEIRQVFDAEDFGEAFTSELREQEERIRAQAASQTK
jgi:hypothetical protein